MSEVRLKPAFILPAFALLAILRIIPAQAQIVPQPCDLHNGTSFALQPLPDRKGFAAVTIGSPESGVAVTQLRDPSYAKMLALLAKGPGGSPDLDNPDTITGKCLAAAAEAGLAQMVPALRKAAVAATTAPVSHKNLRRTFAGEMHHLKGALGSIRQVRHWLHALF